MPESALCAVECPASTVAIDGWTVAASFGDPAAEYAALRDAAALVDLAFHIRMRVTGADRADFLQGMLTNDVKGLVPGRGCFTLLLTEQGKIVADAVALADADAILLDGMASAIGAASPALERFIVADDVELTPGDDDHAFGLYGPHAAGMLARLGIASPPVEDYAHAVVTSQGAPVRIARLPMPGAGGFLVLVPRAAASAWWTRCRDAGVAAAGQQAFDTLRIESGVASYGRDFGPDTLVLEAPLEAAISFNKGCYLGQEVVERVTARGHVNRKLVGLEIAGDAIPADGAPLYVDEREVGRVTSAAWSWRGARPVALGYVRREHLAPGTVLTLREQAGTRSATVRGLPLA